MDVSADMAATISLLPAFVFIPIVSGVNRISIILLLLSASKHQTRQYPAILPQIHHNLINTRKINLLPLPDDHDDTP